MLQIWILGRKQNWGCINYKNQNEKCCHYFKWFDAM